MSVIKITAPDSIKAQALVEISGSKSISNRLLLIQALAPEEMQIFNLSDAEDTKTLLRLLLNSKDRILDCGAAGTTFRFLTAYLSLLPGKHFLTGSKRMLERPIAELVNALNFIGAEIRYAAKNEFPPLHIGAANFSKTGKAVVDVRADISSQFISALLLIATALPNGLTINRIGMPVSSSYVNMTIDLMRQFGVRVLEDENKLTVEAGQYQSMNYTVESDWSSASYFYGIAALADFPVEIKLTTLYRNSLQGDACVSGIMENFGVKSIFSENGELIISKEKNMMPECFEYDFTNCPDLAQTLAVILAGLNIPSKLTGLKTLVFKETDRIVALKTELEKLGCKIKITTESLEILKGITQQTDFKNSVTINTYKDHRMALAFSPLALLFGSLKIDHREVVNKSFPQYWDRLEKLGFQIR
jgi:3-phosphoshikimate 1-carboxyvinyltransferase